MAYLVKVGGNVISTRKNSSCCYGSGPISSEDVVSIGFYLTLKVLLVQTTSVLLLILHSESVRTRCLLRPDPL